MTLHNVCIAASAVSSGLVVPDARYLTCEYLFSYKMGLLSWQHNSVRFLNSIATALIAVLHDASDNMFNSKEEKKLVDVLTKFCKMINKQSDITVPVGQYLQRLALLFANFRSVEIKKNNEKDFSNFFTTKLPMQNKFFVMIPIIPKK
ncbi:hypothetical protein FLA4_04670 [Candidatus Rickettsia kotlanii]|nr:hypothetical protein FLA4_04670 [Candidatus Rickettsia kotlanii]BDU61300.1 hypothetical protein HM2_04680 [Candidatus Rickettsia kotlanii]